MLLPGWADLLYASFAIRSVLGSVIWPFQVPRLWNVVDWFASLRAIMAALHMPQGQLHRGLDLCPAQSIVKHHDFHQR